MKKLWMVIPAMLLIAGMVLTGCGGGTTPTTDPGTVPDITWELSQDGTENAEGLGLTTTTAITITLNADADLTGNNTIVVSTGNVTRGTVERVSGRVWKLPVTVTNPGNVSVEINKAGVERGPKTIRVIKEGAAAPITWTAVADGSLGAETSAKITFTFSKAVTELAAANITITAGTGEATKGALTAVSGSDDKKWELAITDVSQGSVTVKIAKDGIDAGTQSVAVYKATVDPDLYDFTEVEIDWETVGNNHKKGIGIEDFLTIKYSKTGSFLRITFKLLATANGSWGEGKFGEVGKSNGGLDFTIPTSTGTGAVAYGDITVAAILAHLEPDADSIFFNIWNADPNVTPTVELVETKAGTRPTNPGFSTVIFDLDGGTYLNENEIDPVKVENEKALGSKFPGSNPRKAGNVSAGWFVGETQYTSTTPITANVTLKVKWVEGEAETFTVSFDLAGGVLPAGGNTITDIEVEDGQPIGDDFPANPRKAGQWFDGWKDSSDTVYIKTTPITATVSLTATWTANTQPTITREPNMAGYMNPQQIYADGGTDVDYVQGKGNIEGPDLALLKNAPEDAVLVLYIYNTASEGRGGWGLGTFKGNVETDEFKTTSLDSHTTGFVIVDIADLLEKVGATSTYIFVNIYNDCIVQKLEIWEFDAEYVPGTFTETTLTLASEDNMPGKGNLTSGDLALIMAAPAGSYLEIGVNNSGGVGHGVGVFTQWEKDEDDNDIAVSINAPTAGACTARVEVADIKAKFPEASWLAINTWGDGFSSLKLFQPE